MHGNHKTAARHSRPVLWMPDGALELLEASMNPQNLASGTKRHWFAQRSASLPCGCGHENLHYTLIYKISFYDDNVFSLHLLPDPIDAG